MTPSDDAPNSRELTVELNYEFLEDIYAGWMNTNGNGVSQSLSSNENAEYESIDTKTGEQKLRDLEEKENHPLMLMVRCLFLGCWSEWH